MLYVNTSNICNMPKNSGMYADLEEIPNMHPTSLPRLLFPTMHHAATSQPKPGRAFVAKFSTFVTDCWLQLLPVFFPLSSGSNDSIQAMRFQLGMHGIGFFADMLILYDSIRPIPMYFCFFFPSPNCRDQVSSVVKFTYSIFMHTITMLARWQMQA